MSTGWATTAVMLLVAGVGLYAVVLRRRLHTDALTGLGNRRALEIRWAWCRWWQRCRQRCGVPARRVAVLMIDVDRFKVVNDTYGHRVGDVVLSELASVLGAVSGPRLRVYRLHGDEFAVLVCGLDAFTDPTALAGRLATAAGEITVVNGHPLRVSISVGTAVGHPHTTGLSDLLHAADAVMYRRKHAHRGRRIAARRADTATTTQGAF